MSQLSNIYTEINQRLKALNKQGLFRKLTVVKPTAPFIEVNGNRLINFSSNDYLGLANHPKMIESCQKALKKYGVSGTASQFICGYTDAHQALEERLAEFTGYQQIMLFPSGYQANLSLLDPLIKKNTKIITDRYAHASILDAARLSRGHLYRYRHMDIKHAQMLLENNREQPALVITEGVFSMDGDITPLGDLYDKCKQYNPILAIDDAHGFGVLGQDHRGSISAAGLTQQQIPVLMATLGKAVGAAGAFIAGDKTIIEYLRQQARSYRYTTALPPALAVAGTTGIKLLEQEPWRQERLVQLITLFQREAQILDLPIMSSNTAIQPILIGDNQTAVDIAKQLYAAGFWVPAIRTPTVPSGTARLRITLCAHHNPNQLEALLTTLKKFL